MEIVLDKREYPLSIDEVYKVKVQIIRYFMAHLSKLINLLDVWDKYLEKLYPDKKLSAYDILKSGIFSIYFIVSNDIVVFKLDNNRKYKDMDAKLHELCKLINYGNKDIKGCRIFTDTFLHVLGNIDLYIEG